LKEGSSQEKGGTPINTKRKTNWTSKKSDQRKREGAQIFTNRNFIPLKGKGHLIKKPRFQTPLTSYETFLRRG